MSRIYFFMSFLFQVEVFISCREFFHVDIFPFQEENFFLSQVEIFVLFEVFQVDISQLKARYYPRVLVGISWQ